MKKERLVFEKYWMMMARHMLYVAYFSDYTIESIVLTMITTMIMTMILVMITHVNMVMTTVRL